MRCERPSWVPRRSETNPESPAAEPLLQQLTELSLRAGDLDRARAAGLRLLQATRQSGNLRSEANTLRVLGDLELRRKDLGAAMGHYELALALNREIGNPLGEATSREGIGKLRLAEENPTAALPEFRAALQIHRARGDLQSVAASLGYLGRAEAAAGHLAAAGMVFDEALQRHRSLDDPIGQALDLQGQAEALWSLGVRPGALAAWWQARELFRAVRHPMAREIRQTFQTLREQVGEEAFADLAQDLAVHGEVRRAASIAAVRGQALQDPFLAGILEALDE